MSDTSPETPSRSTTPTDFVPAIVLRNKGVPIEVYHLTDGKLPDLGENEDYPVRKVHVRFTANAIAEIEDAWDGIRMEVPIFEDVPKLDADGKPQVDSDGKPLTTRAVVGHEERIFYGQAAFEKMLSAKPTATIRRVLAIAFGRDEEEMGLSMIPEKVMVEYQNAVGVAWAIAQGVDPTEAAKMLKRAAEEIAKRRAEMASEFEKTMGQDEESTTVTLGATG